MMLIVNFFVESSVEAAPSQTLENTDKYLAHTQDNLNPGC